jgi:benzoyl-CoA reductase/2-hydroxyglutaryl-CoA dehydratase subunit BcrC/BadD/HgdB
MCHAFPAAAIAGLGLRPVRLQCGVSAASESEGERLVRADACPLVKSMLGNISAMRGLHAEIDMWIGLHTCDQMRRAHYLMSSELGQEVYPIQLPATRTEEAAGYYASQVRRLVNDITAIHGPSFDPEAAGRWHDDQAAAAEVLSRAARSGGISPLDLHAMFHLFHVARPGGLADFYRKTIDMAPAYESDLVIVLAGGPLALEDTVVLEALQDHGVSVIPLNCTGLNSVETENTDTTHSHADGIDVIERLALESFKTPPCARARPNATVFERIGKTLEQSGASGLLVKCLKFCDHWYTERKRLEGAFDLPVLVMDSVYAEGGRERLLGRTEAFIETLKAQPRKSIQQGEA